MTKKPIQLDVIIVYSGTIAHSANNRKYSEKKPFSAFGRHYAYNKSYQYLLQKCQNTNLKAAFCTSDDIVGPGLFSSYWTYRNKWIRHQHPAQSRLLFDKFTPTNLTQTNQFELLTSCKSIYTFNNRKLTQLFQNKLNTYLFFKEFSIPTVEISHPSKKHIAEAKTKLDNLIQKHKHKIDFKHGYISKDTKGVGGFKIYKVNFDKPGIENLIKQYKIDKNNKELLSYVLQPFIDCRHHLKKTEHKGLIDFRLILVNKTIVQTYIRIAQKGNFKCNEHQGGNLIYLPLNIIPQDILTMTKKITNQLHQEINIENSIYALDFIRSNHNGNLYFIEGNNNPGLDWDQTKTINQNKSKQLIDIIVNKLFSIKQTIAN